jgi:ADP-ribosyl-[dinitrogen reductase] hydrolase
MSALTHYDERFEEGLLRVMELGGDTDTNGAVAGGLLGAAVGTRGLPAEWLERLQDREAIQAEARSLADLAAVRPG